MGASARYICRTKVYTSLRMAQKRIDSQMATDADGVWAVIGGDYRNTIERVYATEIEAYRSVNTQGYYSKILFVPWGLEVSQAEKLEQDQ